MEEKRKVRIGIDVGGTFTDAVAIDSDTFEIISSTKLLTTHAAREGVARGVIDSLHMVMEKGNITPDEICFIAHGTTQATNALLEGDVAKVGIVGMGSGVEGLKAKSDTVLGDVPVSEGKYIRTESRFMDTAAGVDPEKAKEAIRALQEKQCQVIVASEAFSVDNPDNELAVQKATGEMSMESTGGHEISKLYGLKARTLTAVINASILPKMMNTAEMTQQAVLDADIRTPLMIMRCDGGVMKIDELKSRPILTILSGPAAGVAGALMYERVSDGIFFEVGGTSTDISAIKNGKVMINYAEVGGHKTYVTSLDVRTVGIGGGSMISVGPNGIKGVGPRSAHIAGCDYCVYAKNPEIIRGGELEFISPLEGDAKEYAVIVGTDGCKYAITLSCAANIDGCVKEGDYARGNVEAARAGMEKLAAHLKTGVDELVAKILEISSLKVQSVAEKLISDYSLDRNMAILAGGGGGASTVIWPLAKRMNMNAKLSKNAPIISTIGAALAMVRDVVERNIVHPTEADLLKIRQEAEHRAIESGANPATVEVNVEIDSQLNRVRAIAIGTTELMRKKLSVGNADEAQIRKIAVDAMGLGDDCEVREALQNRFFSVYEGTQARQGFFSLLKKRKEFVCVVDKKGIVKLKLEGAKVLAVKAEELGRNTVSVLRQFAFYDENGERTPDVFLLVRAKMVEFRGIPTIEQHAALIRTEASAVDGGEDVGLVVKIKK